jgi:hypothetical protein
MAYPKAKQWLTEQGHDRDEVEAMPVAQVVTLYTLDQFDRLRGEMFKWFALPYHQAQPGMLQSQRQLEDAMARHAGYPFAQLLPAVGRAYHNQVRLDQRIAALRCVEAIRGFAATHEGQLPASLLEIKDMPIPLDPMTGESFAYRIDDDGFTLSGGTLPGDDDRRVVRYRVRLLENQ